MSIIYMCRHCKHVIGQLQHNKMTTSMLGLDGLTADDKRKMVHYQPNGELHIHITCENCEESLAQHPKYHELDFFIH